MASLSKVTGRFAAPFVLQAAWRRGIEGCEYVRPDALGFSRESATGIVAVRSRNGL